MKIKRIRRIAIYGVACTLTLGVLALTPNANAAIPPTENAGYQPVYGGGTDSTVFLNALGTARIPLSNLLIAMENVTEDHKGKPSLTTAVLEMGIQQPNLIPANSPYRTAMHEAMAEAAQESGYTLTAVAQSLHAHHVSNPTNIFFTGTD